MKTGRDLAQRGAPRDPRRVAALFVGLALSLLLAEGVVRALGLGNTTLSKGRLHAHDPDAGWIGAPGTRARFAKPRSFDVGITINRRGIRGPEHAFAKPAGVRRVLLLGDSMVWGQGVEDDETIAAVLERELPATEAINLGVNGYGTVQELVRLETEGLRYAPDWTVLFFTQNDLEDNFDDKDGGRPVVAETGDGGFEIVNRPVRRPWKSGHTQWLRHHSRLFNFLEYSGELRALGQRYRARERRGSAGAPSPAAKQEEREWQAVRFLLGRLADLARRDGAGRLLVVYNTTQGDLRSSDPRRVARRLCALAAELSLPCVDPAPDFLAHPDPDALFLVRDPHWSPAGAALVARRVAAVIASRDAH